MSDLTSPAQVWAALRRRTYQARTPIGTTTIDMATVNQLSALINKFNLARSKGVRTPKIRLDTFLFKAAPPEGANPGAIYVEENKIYLGKIIDGKFMPTRECSSATTARVLQAAADPDRAAEAYGQRTGMCCVCGRTLTNGESIAARIGPICAGNFGF
jgi:Family of unknown function (DUF6011)